MAGMIKIPGLVLAAMIVVLSMQVAVANELQLWTGCRPVFQLIEGLDAEEMKTGLTEERIQIAIESRLRGARIFADYDSPEDAAEAAAEAYADSGSSGDAIGVFYVNVTADNDKNFFVSVEFWLTMGRTIKGENKSGVVTTWDRGVLGRGNDSCILQTIAELTDEFITEYLRVNDEACRK